MRLLLFSEKSILNTKCGASFIAQREKARV
jgi:hypothetical protein